VTDEKVNQDGPRSIIGKDSPFRKLPCIFDKKQILFFDGVRYCVETVDLSFRKLYNILFDISKLKEEEHVPSDYFPLVMQYAWSFIDSTNRLRSLFIDNKSCIEKKEIKKFIDATVNVKLIRNGLQHMDTSIEYLKEGSFSAWGSVGWFYTENISKPFHGKTFCLCPGSLTPDDQRRELINPLGQMLNIPVGMITLTAVGGYKTYDNGNEVEHRKMERCNLCETINDIIKISSVLEQYLSKQVVGSNFFSSDLLLFAELLSDEEKGKK